MEANRLIKYKASDREEEENNCWRYFQLETERKGEDKNERRGQIKR